MSKNRLIFTVLFFGVFIFFVFNKKSLTSTLHNQSGLENTSTPETLKESMPELSPDEIISDAVVEKQDPQATNLSEPEMTTFDDQNTSEAKKTSDVLVHDFESRTRVNIPRGFRNAIFKKSPDIDSNTEGIIGEGANDNLKIAILSRKIATSPAEVQQFISTDLAERLNMKILPENIKPVLGDKPDQSSGFAEVKTWIVTDPVSNKIAIVTLAQRADGKGSYLNVLSGDSDKIEANKGYYENQLSEFKAN
jgi:hypothetical protein